MPKATAIFDANDANMLAALERIDRKLLDAQEKVAKFSEVFKGAFEILMAGEGIGKVIDGVKESLNLGSTLGNISGQTGVAVRDLMELREEFQNVGLTVEDIGMPIDKMLKNIENGSAAATISQLGLNFDEIRRKSPADAFNEIGKAINALPNMREKVEAATDVFGKEGAKLLALFGQNGFGEDSKRFNEQAQLLQQDAALFSDISNELRLAGEKTEGFYTGVADRIAPVLMQTLKAINAHDATSVGQDVGAHIAAIVESLKDGSWAKNLGLQLLDAGVTLVNFLIGGVNGIVLALAGGLMAAGNNLVSLLMSGVARILDALGNAPGLHGLHGAASTLRNVTPIVSVWDTMKDEFDGASNQKLPGTDKLRAATLSAMSAEYAKANKLQADALAASPTLTPGNADGMLFTGSPNVSSLQRIGGAFGASGGGDPLLDENRRQTSVLEQIRAGVMALGGVPIGGGGVAAYQ